VAEFLLNALTTLLVTIDPIGLAPIFLALTRDASPAMRRAIAVRAAVIASVILVVFMLAGTTILTVLGISLPAFRIAGGLLLFWIAFEMVFEKREKRKADSAASARAQFMGGTPGQHVEDLRHLAVFPLAIPLIAGPGAISASILMATQATSPLALAALVLLAVAVIMSCLAIFVAAERIDRLLGETGRSVLTRLLGVLLAALAVQFVADGIATLAHAAARPGPA
jgi:membrane protein, MarC family